jgi:hypothetical protein
MNSFNQLSMKMMSKQIKMILTVIGLTLSFAGNAQTVDSVYIVTYTTGKAWNQAMKVHEQPYFKEHSAHLSNLRKTGVIQIGLRDRDHGILLIYASNLAHAKELIQTDVAIVNNLFDVSVEKANVFYTGCVEKVKPKS